MGSICKILLLLVGFFAVSDGQRWVWGSQRSSRRQSSPSGVLPADETPRGLPGTLLPQAPLPSLRSLPLSLPAVPSPLATLPDPSEPLEFRPLSIDISKLPLATSEEVLPPEGDELAPLAFPLPNPPAGDFLRQNLDPDAPLVRESRQGAFPFEVSESGLPLSISSVDLRGSVPPRRTEVKYLA
ncbi:uncharacterized protein LOC122245311, partial [Penaeus japonicus]|uniref:uncharacterized protein LOC122245311 n=1 Tax=Penaeus japonicus TaxID=27405 RepID=UPI001C714C58